MMHTNLHELLAIELNGLFCVQGQLLKTLPRFESASSSIALQTAFQKYIQNARDQIDRLTDLAIELDIELLVKGCYAMESLIHEGEKSIFKIGEPAVKDSALISMTRKIVHYQIAAYDTSASLAFDCGLKKAEDKLKACLREETLANTAFKKLAAGSFLTTGINQEAAMAS